MQSCFMFNAKFNAKFIFPKFQFKVKVHCKVQCKLKFNAKFIFPKWNDGVLTLTQVFSCEFCGVFYNTFFYGKPRVAASVSLLWLLPQVRQVLKSTTVSTKYHGTTAENKITEGIFYNTFFYGKPRVAASVSLLWLLPQVRQVLKSTTVSTKYHGTTAENKITEGTYLEKVCSFHLNSH